MSAQFGMAKVLYFTLALGVLGGFNYPIHAKFGLMGSYKYSKLKTGFTDFDEHYLDYSPEVRNGAIGFGLLYNDFELSAAISAPSQAGKLGDFKNQSYTDLTGNYWGDKVAVQLYWQRYSGYYAEYSPYRTYSDFTLSKLGLNALFPISPNPAYTAKGLVGRGDDKIINIAAIFGGSVFFNSISSSTNIVEYGDSPYYDRLFGFRNGTFGNIIGVLGGALTLKLSNFYLTPIVNVGIGLQYTEFNKQAAQKPQMVIDFSQAQAMLITGYNSENFFFRFVADFHSAHNNLEDFAGYQTGQYRIFFETAHYDIRAGFFF